MWVKQISGAKRIPKRGRQPNLQLIVYRFDEVIAHYPVIHVENTQICFLYIIQLLSALLVLGIDVVVVEELSGHGSLYQNLFVVLD